MEEDFEALRAKGEDLLKQMISHFRNAMKYRGHFLPSGMMSNIIKQSTENAELREVLQTLPPETLSAFQASDLENLENEELLKNLVSDAEMKAGFDMLKEHFWRLWD